MKHRTVFVLGAGASVPYNFPTGRELRTLLCAGADKQPNRSTELTKILVPAGVDPSEIQDFKNAFHGSGLTSIDAFLARRSNYAELGKLAIAAVLCLREDPGNVLSADPDQDWYLGIWNKLVATSHSPDDFAPDNIRFVTFNYDRSLEYRLHEATKHTFGLDNAQALSVWQKIPILHVYGLLGEFSYESRGNARVYDPRPSPLLLNIAAAGIRIIPDTRHDDAVFEKAREWFHWAAQICFLGFGFDPLNVERLGLAEVLAKRGADPVSVLATTLNLKPAEVTTYGIRLCGENSSRWWPSPNDCLTALREFGLLA